MTILVTDAGFTPAADESFVPLSDLASHTGALDLANTDDPAPLQDQLGNIGLIRIAFPAFNDGRGFTLARRLRVMGDTGRLRAHGHVIADQYTMARRSGFDEVEISEDLATRQPAAQWQFRADWQANDYQSKLRA
ncbi:MAG: DUF934 domain-containing protein [Paracoccaceae bacterium]